MKKIMTAILFFALLPGCRSSRESEFAKYIKYVDHGYLTVVGIAQEGKGGALIEVDSVSRYFIHGLSSWPEYALGKKIKASGKWTTVDRRELANRYSYIQGLRVKHFLEKAEWEIVN